MNDFFDLVYEVFPSIEKVTANQAKTAFSQFSKDPNQYLDLIDSKKSEILKQGDIISNIPFCYLNSEGAYSYFTSEGILISNTCDNSRNRFLQFAPFIRFDDLTKAYENESKKRDYIINLKKNIVTRFFYLHHREYDMGAFDLSIINSISRNRILMKLDKGEIQKKASFNGVGYYIFLIKLSVYFMRIEDLDETDRYIPTTH